MTAESGGRNVRISLDRHNPRTDQRGAYVVTPYDADFVEELKRSIPHTDRAWFPRRRTWFVAEEYESDVIALVVFHFGETMVVTGDGEELYLDETGEEVARQSRLF